MKYLWLFVLGSLFFYGCGGLEKKEGEFLIEGKIRNYAERPVYLVESNAQGKPPVDSMQTDTEGNFHFNGTAENDAVFHVQMEGKKSLSLVPESDHLILEIDWEDVPNYQVTGNVKSTILKDFTLRQARLYSDYIQKKRGLNLISKKTTMEKWRAQEAKADKALMAFRSYLRTFADTVSYPVLSAYAVLSLNPEGNFFYLQEFLPELRKRGAKSPYLEYAERTLAEIGEPFLRYEARDIAEVNLAGDSIHLTDLRGKVVLLHIWASYCEFSRQENRRLVEAMQKHPTDDFVIFSYSIDEEDADWRQAMAADGLPGKFHARGDAGWDSKPFNFFAVESVPTTFLLDYRGIVRSKNVRAEDIVAHLPELLTKYGKPDGSGS